MRRPILAIVFGALLSAATFGQTAWQDFDDAGALTATGIYLFFEPGPGTQLNITGQQIIDGVLALVISIDGDGDGDPEVSTSGSALVRFDPDSDGDYEFVMDVGSIGGNAGVFAIQGDIIDSDNRFRFYNNGGGRWFMDSGNSTLVPSSNTSIEFNRFGVRHGSITFQNWNLMYPVHITGGGLAGFNAGDLMDLSHDATNGTILTGVGGISIGGAAGCILHGSLATAPAVTLCAQYFDTNIPMQCISLNGSTYVQMDDFSTQCT